MTMEEQYKEAYDYFKDSSREDLLVRLSSAILDLNAEFGYHKPEEHEASWTINKVK